MIEAEMEKNRPNSVLVQKGEKKRGKKRRRKQKQKSYLISYFVYFPFLLFLYLSVSSKGKNQEKGNKRRIPKSRVKPVLNSHIQPKEAHI